MEVELEREVIQWYLALGPDEQDVVAVHVELLAEYGHRLRLPHSRPLGGRRAWRITYWHRPDGVVVLLTVFRKQRDNERAEVRRARAALDLCRSLHGQT